MEFRRRLYKRGSSYETTVPMPALLALDAEKKYDVIFTYDPQTKNWILRFEERDSGVAPEAPR